VAYQLSGSFRGYAVAYRRAIDMARTVAKVDEAGPAVGISRGVFLQAVVFAFGLARIARAGEHAIGIGPTNAANSAGNPVRVVAVGQRRGAFPFDTAGVAVRN
jgi:hypothetical protein